jgi:Xaa-Pro dipeptidase
LNLSRRRGILVSPGGSSGTPGADVRENVERPESHRPESHKEAGVSQPQIPFEAFRERAERTRELMGYLNLDGLLATPSVNLRYLMGCPITPSERFLALLFRKESPPVVVAPLLERDRILASPMKIELMTWRDDEDPFEPLRRLVGGALGITIGLEPRTDYAIYQRLVRAIPEANWVDGAPVFERLRQEKGEDELRCMRAAVAITEEVFGLVPNLVREGMSERELAVLLAREMDARGGEGSQALVQFAEGTTIPHGAPGGRALGHGDLILIDMGTIVCGYHSDLTRAFAFRHASEAMRALYAVVREAQAAAIEAARPDVPAEEIDRAARDVVQRHEYGIHFTHRTGHGIGLDGHEPPYLVKGNRQPLRPGMVVSIEPGIYLAGRMGVRLEDEVVVTHEGRSLLSSGPGELRVVG